MKQRTDEKHVLLICTVGGSHEPIARSIREHIPERIIFLPSEATAGKVPEIVSLLARYGLDYSPAQYDVMKVFDPEDFSHCVEDTRRLGKKVAEWLDKGESFWVVVDFTGGTKCMAAALALVSRQWQRCCFSYIGGTERSKGGLGTVISGKERPLRFVNPWESLGYQIVEEASLFFDRGDYGVCKALLENVWRKVSRKDISDALYTFAIMTEAYHEWDLFRHNKAYELLKKVLDARPRILYLLPDRGQEMVSQVEKNWEFLAQLQGKVPNRYTILDLIANAQRCARKGRYDDAVARLYRVTEALSQIRLFEKYKAYYIGIDGRPDFSRLLPENIPEPARSTLLQKAEVDGSVKLALRDNYRLLEALNDDLGVRFRSLENIESLLGARNLSIFGHGFQPVSQETYEGLFRAVKELAEVREGELPEFPTLAGSPFGNGTDDRK